MKKYFQIILFLVSLVYAAFPSYAQRLETADYSDLAKNKTYIGGSEEGELRMLPPSFFQINNKDNSEEGNEGF